MKVQHTPGPWKVDHTMIRIHNGLAICHVYCPEEGSEMAHNAHLIAAAPEMLEALKACFQLNGKGVHTGNDIELCDLVCNAIAKAEGRA